MSSTNLNFLKSEAIDRKETCTGTSVGEVLYLREDDLQSNDVTNREADSEQIKKLTEQNRSQASQILKLKADSIEDQATFNAQLREYQSKMDSLNSDKQTLLERIEVLTQQNNRQHSENKLRIFYFIQAASVCILAIIFGVYLHLNTVSESNILREQNAALIEQKSRQASQIEKLEANSKVQRERFEKLETDSKAQLREYQITLDAVKSENLLLRDQIEFANDQNGFLQSHMKQMSDEFKEKNDKAMTDRLQESQFHKEGVNYLVQCLLDKDSASETFTGINLFWGAVQVGYTTKSGLNNCLAMYEAHYHQRISYQIDQ